MAGAERLSKLPRAARGSDCIKSADGSLPSAPPEGGERGTALGAQPVHGNRRREDEAGPPFLPDPCPSRERDNVRGDGAAVHSPSFSLAVLRGQIGAPADGTCRTPARPLRRRRGRRARGLRGGLRRGFRRHVRPGGREALEALARETFDVLVSDMRMEPMQGSELLARAYAEHNDVQRILLTGFSDHDDLADAVNLGPRLRLRAEAVGRRAAEAHHPARRRAASPRAREPAPVAGARERQRPPQGRRRGRSADGRAAQAASDLARDGPGARPGRRGRRDRRERAAPRRDGRRQGARRRRDPRAKRAQERAASSRRTWRRSRPS